MIDMKKEDVKNDLENIIVELTETGSISLSKSDRLNENFFIANDLVFAGNTRGPVEVYSLRSTEKVMTIPFTFLSCQSKHAIAHDGEFIYFDVEGDFKIKDEDIILARLPKNAGEFDCAEFIGRSVEELRRNEYIPNQAKEGGIVSRIVSVPIEMVSRPGEIWDIDEFLNDGKRFLVTRDMGLASSLFSGPGYVSLGWKSDPHYESLWDSTTFFRKGGLYLPEDGEIEKLHEVSSIDRKIPVNVEIKYSHSQERIVASNNIPFYNEEKHEEDEEYFPLNVVFHNGADFPNRILGLEHDDDRVFVLTNRRYNRRERKGISYVTEPYQIKTYQVKLLNTSPRTTS